MSRDLKTFAQKIVESMRKGVQVERMWQEKLEADLKKKQVAQSK